MRVRTLGAVAFALLVSGCNNNYLPPTPSTSFGQGALLTLVSQAASDNRVPAALLYAVVQAESGGDPNAISAHGAMGLMQLMPATATQCGLTRPFDPHGNLECGASYLSQMLARFHDDLTLAVAAYNAGPEAVTRAHGIPPKSQGYVQRVMTLYQTASAAAGPAEPKR